MALNDANVIDFVSIGSADYGAANRFVCRHTRTGQCCQCKKDTKKFIKKFINTTQQQNGKTVTVEQ